MVKYIYHKFRNTYFYYYNFLFLILKNIKFHNDFFINGFLRVYKSDNGTITFGKKLKINNGHKYNPIGRQEKTSFFVEGILVVGENVAMSSTTIVCKEKVTIGNNVLIGGNTVIYDTDFHSLNYKDWFSERDIRNSKTKAISIGNNVFIGAHTTILKGVQIGNNVIVGACSVLTKNIPPDEVWAGNPARFIKYNL